MVTLTATDGTRDTGRTLGDVTLAVVSMIFEIWSALDLQLENINFDINFDIEEIT